MSPPGEGGPLARLIDMLNARELGRVAAAMTEDVQLRNLPLGETIEGRTALIALIRHWLEAVPDGTIEPVNLVEGNDESGGELLLRGTYTGPWNDGPVNRAALQLPLAVACSLQGGAVRSLRLYYDLATLLQAVGAL